MRGETRLNVCVGGHRRMYALSWMRGGRKEGRKEGKEGKEGKKGIGETRKKMGCKGKEN